LIDAITAAPLSS